MLKVTRDFSLCFDVLFLILLLDAVANTPDTIWEIFPYCPVNHNYYGIFFQIREPGTNSYLQLQSSGINNYQFITRILAFWLA